MGDFTHPSGGEERAGGVTRTIQKVVSVQLQTRPPRVRQTETKGTKPVGNSHPDRQTQPQQRRARKGQKTVQRTQNVKHQ